jgi:hypothetical protein
MLTTVLVIGGAVAAWLIVDRLLQWRDERLQRGSAAWNEVVRSRTFHSTGWDETLPPTAVPDPPVDRRRTRNEVAA